MPFHLRQNHRAARTRIATDTTGTTTATAMVPPADKPESSLLDDSMAGELPDVEEPSAVLPAVCEGEASVEVMMTVAGPVELPPVGLWVTMVVTTSDVDDVVDSSDDVDDVVVGVSEVEVGVVDSEVVVGVVDSEVVVGVVLLASGVLLVTASDVVEDSDDVVDVSVGVASVEDDVLVGVGDASAEVSVDDSAGEAAAALLLETGAAAAEDVMMRSDERTTGGRVVVRGLEYEVPYGRAQKPATTQIHPTEEKKIDRMAQ